MALPATDDFGINQDPLAGNWTAADDFTVNLLVADSGLLKGKATQLNHLHAYFWDADAFNADQYAEGTTVSDNNFPAVIVRQRNSDDQFFWAYFHPSRIYVQHYDGAGSFTSITGGSYITYSMAEGSVFRIEAEGDNVRVKDDGSQIGSDYDVSAYSVDDGSAGVGSGYTLNSTDGIFTDWEGGNLGVAAVAPTGALYGPLVGPLSGPI